jgi:uncharacterized protein (DUF433 family)
MMDRITFNPAVLGGRATVRGLRISVSHLVNLVANGMKFEEILADYPDLEEADIRESLRFAAKMTDDQMIPLPASAA